MSMAQVIRAAMKKQGVTVSQLFKAAWLHDPKYQRQNAS